MRANYPFNPGRGRRCYLRLRVVLAPSGRWEWTPIRTVEGFGEHVIDHRALRVKLRTGSYPASMAERA